jgi:ribosomal protein L11 methyltransferase
VHSSPKRWLELRAKLAEPQRVARRRPDDGELAEALVALGGRAVEERADWLVTHFPEPDDSERFLADAAARLEQMVGARVAIAHAWCDPEDWAEAWKRGLAPRRITPRLWVTPSWEEAELRARVEPGARVVVVDPGMAFGTAEHGTTRGALRLLDRALAPRAHVLDVGAGSAILAVAAALLGAERVIAIEGDPVAGEYARENLARNGVAERVDWIEAWADADLLRSLGPADGILANIESGVLRRLLPGLLAALRPGGWLILSGVLGEEWEAFAQEVRHRGFSSVDVDADGDWRSGWFTRSEP